MLDSEQHRGLCLQNSTAGLWTDDKQSDGRDRVDKWEVFGVDGGMSLWAC